MLRRDRDETGAVHERFGRETSARVADGNCRMTYAVRFGPSHCCLGCYDMVQSKHDGDDGGGGVDA